MRVTAIAIAEDQPTDQRYSLQLELSPQTGTFHDWDVTWTATRTAGDGWTNQSAFDGASYPVLYDGDVIAWHAEILDHAGFAMTNASLLFGAIGRPDIYMPTLDALWRDLGWYGYPGTSPQDDTFTVDLLGIGTTVEWDWLADIGYIGGATVLTATYRVWADIVTPGPGRP